MMVFLFASSCDDNAIIKEHQTLVGTWKSTGHLTSEFVIDNNSQVVSGTFSVGTKHYVVTKSEPVSLGSITLYQDEDNFITFLDLEFSGNKLKCSKTYWVTEYNGKPLEDTATVYLLERAN